MDENSEKILRARYEFCSYALEREAYRQQMEGRTKPLKHFYPCAKALIFTDGMKYPVKVTMLVIPKAALTPCNCHKSMGEKELWDLYDQAIKAVPYEQTEADHQIP